nr:hypothetical protein [Escherichia coli]
MINEEQFVKVPMWILKISQVNGHKFTDSAKNLYCYLRGFDRAFPSYAKIGDVFGITPRAAEERVKKLLEMGGNDSNLLIVFYVQIMPDDFVMQLHRF